MDVKEQIKRSISITDVVSQYVNLKQAGKYLKGLCPFHTEKTPSFFVMPEKDSFACYGCNKFGDIFTFVQEIENLAFPDAMNYLVEKFNIPIQRDNQQRFVKKDEYVKINEIAMKYFRNNLLDSVEGKKAKAYLKQRGILPKTVDLFGMGYAENRWDGLYNHLRQKSCNIEKSIQLGLLVKNDSNRIYDRFRGRIIFPIISESGTPIAFGGRTIFDEPNKYLNSPDTPLYKKSKHLYGFNLSKDAVRDKKYSVLVEGYFDVVSLYQSGVQNVAASLGTALTDSQIYLLKRFSDNIYIFYDSDKAGVAAAIRGIEKMFEQNINPGIIALQNEKDPDDFIRENGLKAFHQLVENAVDGFRFLVRHISGKYNLNVPEQKNDAVRELMSFVNKFGEPIIKNEYARIAADFFKVDEKLLKLNEQPRKKREPNSANRTNSTESLTITPAERIFLEAIIAMPQLIAEVKPLISKEILSVLASHNIIRQLMGHFNEKNGAIDDFHNISAQLSDAERGEFMNIFQRAKTVPKDTDMLLRDIEASYLTFQDLLNKRDARRIDQEIKLAARNGDMNKVRSLMEEKQRYRVQKYQMKSGANKPENETVQQ